MSAQVPQVMDRDAPIFAIGVAAHLAGMHPQTLRGYDKLGLVQPRRAKGRGRRYSLRDVQRLRLIQHLSQTEGINLTGIQRILDMEAEIERLRAAVQRVSTQRDELAQQLAAGGRVFTAETSGAVHLGRVIHGQRALPGR
ncbi:heat shock protein transcriptional repressor HspR [Aestuariimicrobium kwangyangense]|uniref:heat shock protein transcriptional repressor HspR n=1 Tax=Aestuariimicrobium kwangyangense TaxID=396389 RepID=UPI0003B2F7A7|nr:MerR family transcriptional regulator [Aestuariimicrobium kwangyangense]